MPRVVILGTGTNVGKTHVTRALAHALRVLCPNTPVVALKPIESGFKPGPGSDAYGLAEASTDLTLPRPHPFLALSEPVSPHLAARRAKLPPIDLHAITAWLADWEARLPPHVRSCGLWSLLETAGATFSPLSPQATNFDLATRLGPALWVLVAPDCLGVLHDVRVTWEACAHRGRTPDFLVLSAARAADASTGSNADELRILGLPNPLLTVARDSSDVSRLAHALLANADAVH